MYVQKNSKHSYKYLQSFTLAENTFVQKSYLFCNNVLSTVCVFVYILLENFLDSKRIWDKTAVYSSILTNIYKVSPLLRTHLYNKVFYFVTMCCQQCVFCLHFVGNFLDSKRIWDKTAVYSKVFLQISTKFHACWELIWTKMLFLL